MSGEETGADSGKKHLGLFWLAAIILLAALTAGGLPILARKTPWSWEVNASEMLGDLPIAVCRRGSAEAPARALAKLVARLYPLPDANAAGQRAKGERAGDSRFTISVHIARGNEINAFAFLGGKIFVYAKLLKTARSPEELAGVLAHEISHVENRHIMQGLFTRVLLALVENSVGIQGSLSQILRQAMNLQFTRAQEEEADRGAIERLQRAGVSTQGMLDFFERLEAMGASWEILSDHPSAKDRAEMVRRSLAKNGATTAILSEEEWRALQQYCSASEHQPAADGERERNGEEEDSE